MQAQTTDSTRLMPRLCTLLDNICGVAFVPVPFLVRYCKWLSTLQYWLRVGKSGRTSSLVLLRRLCRPRPPKARPPPYVAACNPSPVSHWKSIRAGGTAAKNMCLQYANREHTRSRIMSVLSDFVSILLGPARLAGWGRAVLNNCTTSAQMVLQRRGTLTTPVVAVHAFFSKLFETYYHTWKTHSTETQPPRLLYIQ